MSGLTPEALEQLKQQVAAQGEKVKAAKAVSHQGLC
jgi:hypothetical protein